MTDAFAPHLPEPLVRALAALPNMIPDPGAGILVRGARAFETALVLKRTLPGTAVWARPDDPAPWRGVAQLLDGLLEGTDPDPTPVPTVLVFTGKTAAFREMVRAGGIPATCRDVLAIVTPDPPELPGAWMPTRTESRAPWQLHLWCAADPSLETRALQYITNSQFNEALRLLRTANIPAPPPVQSLRERLVLTCLYQMADRKELPVQLALCIAQRHWFSLLTLGSETEHEYRLMSEFWNRVGERDNALKLMSVVSPDLGGVPRAAVTDTSAPCPEKPPPWPGRVLFILPQRAHYGLDVLYEGLCDVLGDAQVVDFPRKSTLHGVQDPQLAHYPCQIDRGAAPVSFEALLEQTRASRFDLILQGILEPHEWTPEAGELIRAAAGRIPVVLTDAQDEMDDFREVSAAFCGVSDFLAYLKRERIRGFDYGPEVIPFPFAYPDRLIPDETLVTVSERDIPLFWAGQSHGLRRCLLEQARRITDLPLEGFYPPDQYKTCLLRARAGLSLAGGGFDTVRYWEIPAHGALLISETLPIEIPRNFRHGIDAFFFRTPAELAEIWAWCITHPQDAREMALAGYRRLKAHHTARARALQVLWALYGKACRKGVIKG